MHYMYAHDIKKTQTALCADCCNSPTNCWSMCFETKPKKAILTDKKNVEKK